MDITPDAFLVRLKSRCAVAGLSFIDVSGTGSRTGPVASYQVLRALRSAGTGLSPHNLDVVLEQYTKEKTEKILRETQEILTWLTHTFSKR